MTRTSLRTPTLAALTAAALLAGCATEMSERQKGTATGAAIGAVAGAVLSSATGGKAGTGAVVGGAVGAVAGNLWSKRMEEKRAAMEKATQPKTAMERKHRMTLRGPCRSSQAPRGSCVTEKPKK